MNEKILCKSQQIDLNPIKAAIVICIVVLVLSLVCYAVIDPIQDYIFEVCDDSNTYWEDWGLTVFNVTDALEYVLPVLMVICVALILYLSIFYFLISKTEMVITNMRVYGRAAFGKRVDLPLDSISAIGAKSPKGISVATSSGRIAFLMVKNRDEIHKCIGNLLVERQNKPTSESVFSAKQEIPQSNADELKKYKDLLDSGVISQEEFDAKKKQLLGL